MTRGALVGFAGRSSRCTATIRWRRSSARSCLRGSLTTVEIEVGGAARNRTGGGGFADLCLTAWRRRPWRERHARTTGVAPGRSPALRTADDGAAGINHSQQPTRRATRGQSVASGVGRRGPASEQPVGVAPRRPFHLSRRPASVSKMERETGFEPATSTLARSHSTTELFPPCLTPNSTQTRPRPATSQRSAGPVSRGRTPERPHHRSRWCRMAKMMKTRATGTTF